LWVFRASSLGNCTRNLVLTAMGLDSVKEPMPDTVVNGMKEGVIAEPVIIGAVSHNHGWKPLDGLELNLGVGKTAVGYVDDTGQLCLDLRVGNHAIVRCHPDGIVKRWFKTAGVGDTGDPIGTLRVLEAKAIMGPEARVWERSGYAWQLSVEMAASGLKAVYAVGAKEDGKGGGTRGVVLLENVKVDLVDVAPWSLVQIKQRVMKLVRVIEASIAEGKVTVDCDVKQWPCGYYKAWHGEQGVWGDVADTDNDAVVIGVGLKVDVGQADLLFRRWEMAKFNEKAAKDELEKVKDELDELMRCADGFDEGEVVDGKRVTTYRCEGGNWEVVHRIEPARPAYTTTPKPVNRLEIRKKK